MSKKIIDKTTILLDQAVSKKNNEEFTGEEVEQLLMNYIAWIESKGLMTGGGCGFYEEEN